MNVRIITASAGTGKTTRLAELLERAVSSASARPEAILATTFTKQAAAELQNRARTRLLQGGHGRQAQALLTARIGTVNAVCGSLVTDFSFQLGLSPELRVLDEAGAELELKRALASVVTEDLSDRLQAFSARVRSGVSTGNTRCGSWSRPRGPTASTPAGWRRRRSARWPRWTPVWDRSRRRPRRWIGRCTRR